MHKSLQRSSYIRLMDMWWWLVVVCENEVFSHTVFRSLRFKIKTSVIVGILVFRDFLHILRAYICVFT